MELGATIATGVFGFAGLNAMMTEATIVHCQNIWRNQACRLDKLTADHSLQHRTVLVAGSGRHREFEGMDEVRVGGDALNDVVNNTARPPFDSFTGEFDEIITAGESVGCQSIAFVIASEGILPQGK